MKPFDLNSTRKYLVIILWLVGLHSFFVALGMLSLPASAMTFFGFDLQEGNFFRAQGGAFHIVMSAVYVLAAYHINKSTVLITTSVFAKLVGTVFLFSYYLFVNPIWTVLVSGIGDFLMGGIILLLFLKYNKLNR